MDTSGVPLRESLPEWQRLKLAKLELALGADARSRLNVQERRILIWLASFDDWTVDGVVGMFNALREELRLAEVANSELALAIVTYHPEGSAEIIAEALKRAGYP